MGFDAGALIQINDELSFGVMLQDINSKYKWDTKSIYGENGRSTDDKFPTLRRIALCYTLPSNIGIITAEFENSSEKTNIIRFGTEYKVTENFIVRGGIDRWDFSDEATGAKPSFGFTIKNPFNAWTPAINYAYVIESFAPHGMHIITLSTTF